MKPTPDIVHTRAESLTVPGATVRMGIFSPLTVVPKRRRTDDPEAA